jgi:solute carrier family 25 protein 38
MVVEIDCLIQPYLGTHAKIIAKASGIVRPMEGQNRIMAESAGRKGSARHFVAGFGSGIASALLLQPLDLLKTRVQQHHGSSSVSFWIREIYAGQARSSPPLWIPNLALGLWRGTVPSVLRTGTGSALYFTSLDFLRRRTFELGGRNHLRPGTGTAIGGIVDLASGAAARTFAGFATMPLTVLKVRYESNMYSYQSLAPAVRSVYSQGGIAAFFAGFGATAIRDAPYAGIYVFFYELCKRHLESSLGTTHSPLGTEAADKARSAPPAAINFVSGIMAGATCSAISNPFDVVKTRIQLQPCRYRNLMASCRLIIAEEGIRAMFSGIGLRMSRKALSSALAWTLYEELIRRANIVY